jgi:hypothetical protein
VNGDDLKPGATVRLSGTGSEGVVVAVTGGSVQVRLASGAVVSSSVYQVQVIDGPQPKAKREPAAKKTAKPKRRKR